VADESVPVDVLQQHMQNTSGAPSGRPARLDVPLDAPPDLSYIEDLTQPAELDEPTNEEYDLSLKLFGGILAPITRAVILNYQERQVTFHILSLEEEEAILDAVRGVAPHLRVVAEARMRLYFSFMAVDGEIIPLQGQKKYNWLKKIPGVYVDALTIAYEAASREPVTRLNYMQSAPNSGAAPS
jgi:hypothetical protein